MQATARRLSVVSAKSCARRRLIRDVRPRTESIDMQQERTSLDPRRERSAIFAVRGFGYLLVAVWGWYIATMIRTSDWGYDDMSTQVLGATSAFVILALPFALLPLIGLPWSRMIGLLLVLALLCIGGAEIFGRTQEHLLVQRLGTAPTADYTETRWWPFAHHSLGFVQGRWWGCD